ncbi:MAG: ATP-binding protein [Acidimicrobiia bacterium]
MRPVGPGRHIGLRIFGFLLFVLVMSAIVGGLIAWVLAPGRGIFLAVGLLVIVGLALTLRAVFRRNWAPVSELIDATTRLGEGDSGVRMDGRSKGPWSAVTTSFNRMAERLEEDDERRRRLIADLGHELRTPLTVIQGEIEAVLDGVHPPASLRNVVDEVDLMDRLLDDLRTLALAEAGQLALILEPTDIGDLAGDVVTSFSSIISTQEIELQLHIANGSVVEVDPHRLHQVISNLVSNALRKMPDGGRLSLTVDGRRITVEDTGPGIADAEIDSIFNRFERGSDSSGSGLGLSIVRDLVEAHGGTIRASNRVGGGAVFEIELA